MRRDPERDLAVLCRRLGHDFADPQRLRLALRHRSVGSSNNERLEFLGDALLGAVMADLLYRHYPEADEGDLSRLRATLVRRSSLARVAGELGLADHVVLGAGELKSGGAQRESILADAVEAILGAIYLDAGYAACHACIERLFTPMIAGLPRAAALKDPKTRLQEHLQGRGQPLPEYELLDVSGAGHAQRFSVACLAQGARTQGLGRSRRKAEQAAAARMLEQLGVDVPGAGA